MHVISLLTTLVGVLLTARIPELTFTRNVMLFNSTYFGRLAVVIAGITFLSCATVMIWILKNIHFSVVLMYNGSVGVMENVVVNAIAFPYIFSVCTALSVQQRPYKFVRLAIDIFRSLCSKDVVTLCYR